MTIGAGANIRSKHGGRQERSREDRSGGDDHLERLGRRGDGRKRPPQGQDGDPSRARRSGPGDQSRGAPRRGAGQLLHLDHHRPCKGEEDRSRLAGDQRPHPPRLGREDASPYRRGRPQRGHPLLGAGEAPARPRPGSPRPLPDLQCPRRHGEGHALGHCRAGDNPHDGERHRHGSRIRGRSRCCGPSRGGGGRPRHAGGGRQCLRCRGGRRLHGLCGRARHVRPRRLWPALRLSRGSGRADRRRSLSRAPGAARPDMFEIDSAKGLKYYETPYTTRPQGRARAARRRRAGRRGRALLDPAESRTPALASGAWSPPSPPPGPGSR